MSYVQYFCSQSLVEHVLPVGEVPGRVRPPTPLVRDPYNPGFNVAETLPYFAANTSSGCEASAWPSAATEVRQTYGTLRMTEVGLSRHVYAPQTPPWRMKETNIPAVVGVVSIKQWQWILSSTTYGLYMHDEWTVFDNIFKGWMWRQPCPKVAGHCRLWQLHPW